MKVDLSLLCAAFNLNYGCPPSPGFRAILRGRNVYRVYWAASAGGMLISFEHAFATAKLLAKM